MEERRPLQTRRRTVRASGGVKWGGNVDSFNKVDSHGQLIDQNENSLMEACLQSLVAPPSGLKRLGWITMGIVLLNYDLVHLRNLKSQESKAFAKLERYLNDNEIPFHLSAIVEQAHACTNRKCSRMGRTQGKNIIRTDMMLGMRKGSEDSHVQ
eukprot:gnl/TRDRNA2_/TRDRNA2_150563_c1_seq1.p1 gnl/TRDRNA2_/TRDRNA2_150563_c1~~gnl/TRDRNA2_/TRDRNA2_150563_c1_seq1.p1  ORF type:complete len:154 (-),score=19.72 gnl/TRDRNA2_/TRDRNA2_150563_c1_seq1:81-542(-)